MFIELSDLRRALNKNEVVPFFQPVVDLRSGGLRGFEVLARWIHPEHGPILPQNFIALAEANDLIDELMVQLCRKAFRVSNLLSEDLTLAINVSPVQMKVLSLPIQIRDEAEAAGFKLSQLVIEITESALHHDLERAQQVAGSLRSLGCRLALDDFGTGYSSLRQLQSIQFDVLKIDRSFVEGMTTERNSRKIVAAIIGLGHSLGMDTLAEGVETEEQADMLIWLGCQQAQGWRYGRAEPANGMAAQIAAAPISSQSGLGSPGSDWAASSLEGLPTLRLAHLQAIYDGAPVGLCFLDNKLRYVSMNRRLAEMNGHSVKDHLGRSVQEMYPEWFPIYEPFYLRALRGEAISGAEFVRPGLNIGDHDHRMVASYQPAWDEADEVIGISVSLLDVTEQKQSDIGAVSQAIPHKAADAVNAEYPWVMDSEGNDLQVSAQWVQTTPLGKDRTRNLHWLEAVHNDDLEPTIKIMKQALRTGTPINVEYRVRGDDGEWSWVRSRGVPRFGVNGEITRWYGSVEHFKKPTKS